MPNAKLKNYLHLHLIVFIWGFTAILGELISIDALPLVWYRMFIATGFIYLYIRIKKIPLKVSKKTFKILFLSGVIIALHWITFFTAIKVSNISITLAMLSTGAFFTSILEPVFYNRKVVWYEIIFGLFVIIGLYIIFQVEGSYVEGILYALVSALLSSIFAIINGKIVQDHDPSMISYYEMLTGVGVISLYLGWASIFGAPNEGFSFAFFNLSSNDWIYLILLASVCTAYAFIVSIGVMKYLSPYTVMLTINLEPIYGIVLAYYLFQETEEMNPQFYYGALLILATVICNGIFKNIKKSKRQAILGNITN